MLKASAGTAIRSASAQRTGQNRSDNPLAKMRGDELATKQLERFSHKMSKIDVLIGQPSSCLNATLGMMNDNTSLNRCMK